MSFKILKTFSKDEYILEEEDALNLETLLVSGKTGFVKLRTGELINIASIEALKGPALVPRYKGYPVLKDGIHFVEDGVKMMMIDPDKIEYVVDTKYKKLLRQKLLKDGK